MASYMLSPAGNFGHIYIEVRFSPPVNKTSVQLESGMKQFMAMSCHIVSNLEPKAGRTPFSCLPVALTGPLDPAI